MQFTYTPLTTVDQLEKGTIIVVRKREKVFGRSIQKDENGLITSISASKLERHAKIVEETYEVKGFRKVKAGKKVNWVNLNLNMGSSMMVPSYVEFCKKKGWEVLVQGVKL